MAEHRGTNPARPAGQNPEPYDPMTARSMNLKRSLILRIIGAASLCLLGAVAYLLWQAERDLQRAMASAADFAARQLDKQLLHVAAGLESQEHFPQWPPSPAPDAPGLCLAYAGPDGAPRKSVCNGWKGAGADTPDWFAVLHRKASGPERSAVRPIAWRGRAMGSVVVSANADAAAAQAWRDIRSLIGLQLASVTAVCLLIYASVSRALKPAGTIMAGLARLESGDLTIRLPEFQLTEFREIGEGFNRLATRLRDGAAERTALTRRLFLIQEEERRALARDLHDEFGQCLAGVAALAASVSETAKRDCPGLLREGESIARICGHMMQTLRETLRRLRPAEIELGLTESLHSLIAGWNDRLAGKTRFVLEARGDGADLPGAIGLSVFRIVQECLTNAARHAGATRVTVTLERGAGRTAGGAEGEGVTLTVEDDGAFADGALAARPSQGAGLLGMRERAAALGGALTLEKREPAGLRVRVFIPIPDNRGEGDAS